jgi:colanic acid biosynthesis glycosyl transferase WcaI
MSNILILTLNFRPDGVSTAALVSDLADELMARGHRIVVITTIPHSNFDADARAEQPLTRLWGGLLYRSTYHGIPVWHTQVTRKGQHILGRMIGYFLFNLTSLLIGLFGVGRQDIVLVVSPPLTSGIIGWFLAIVKQASFIYNIQELYPDVFVNLKKLRPNSLGTRVLYWIEHFVYQRADALTVICEAFRTAVIHKGIDKEKIHLIPNFADTKAIYPAPKFNPFSVEHSLTTRFVILYAGNIGMTQSFEALLETAYRLKDEPEIKLLIIGGGVRADYVAFQIKQRALKNVLLLPYQPQSRVLDMYAAADISLVPLMTNTSQTTFPSKLYTIMSSGRPVIAAIDVDSDVVETIKQARCGVAVEADNPESLEHAIRNAYHQQAMFQEFGKNGRAYVETHFSRQQAGTMYHELIMRMLDKKVTVR